MNEAVVEQPSARHRVFVHVGLPKTGTTFLQAVMFANRERLRRHGVCYPADRYDDHFFAAVDLQQLPFAHAPRPEAAGAWAAVAARVTAWPTTSVISHDVLAGAGSTHARTAVESLAPAEVHIVATVRDLAQALPSYWQEDVKHGQRLRFAQWYANLADPTPSRWQLPWFFSVEHIPEVLARWTAAVPPERVHVVTVPRGDDQPERLWGRFASVIGVDPAVADLASVRHPNRALGIAETELVRRINEHRDAGLSQVDYEHSIKGLLVHETLAERPDQRRFGLPARLDEPVAAMSQEWVEQLAARRYDIVGDLAELLPQRRSVPPEDPDSAGDSEVVDTAVFAVQRLAVRASTEAARAAAEAAAAQQLREELAATTERWREHEQLPHRERVKRTVVEIGRTSPGVGRVLTIYRRMRRRPSG